MIGSGTKGESPGSGGTKEASEISGWKDSVRGALRSLGFSGAIGDSRELKIVSAIIKLLEFSLLFIAYDPGLLYVELTNQNQLPTCIP